ncbi:MAG TPA: nitroreductase [Chloroflexia bacterium]|nr:nitroreductase [Chloroflexia bacterium]
MVDSETIEAVVRQRRSFRLKDLKPDPVPRALVERLLEAARWAPNHGHTEPWRFAVYTGEGRRALGDALGEAYRLGTPAAAFDATAQAGQRDRVWQAPVWIGVGMVVGTNPKIPEVEEVLALGAAVQNLLLVATALGLGSKWTTGLAATHPHTAAFVGLAPPARLLGFVYVGWPAVPWPAGGRAELGGKVTWVEG